MAGAGASLCRSRSVETFSYLITRCANSGCKTGNKNKVENIFLLSGVKITLYSKFLALHVRWWWPFSPCNYTFTNIKHLDKQNISCAPKYICVADSPLNYCDFLGFLCVFVILCDVVSWSDVSPLMSNKSRLGRDWQHLTDTGRAPWTFPHFS